MSKEIASIRTILDKEKLAVDGSNFMDWYRALRIVLKREKKAYVLTKPLPAEAPTMTVTVGVGDEAREVENLEYVLHNQHVEDELDVSTLMLATMAPDLQKRFEDQSSFLIMDQLSKMFLEQARVERYRVTRSLLQCRMSEGSSVSSHILKMMSYLEQLDKLDCSLKKEFAMDIVLNSLSPSYSGFIMNYHMHGMDKSLDELHGMLKTAESDMKKATPSVLMVSDKGKKAKKDKSKRKSKAKGKNKGKGKVADQPKVDNPAPVDAECYHCKGKGHYRRHCPKYLKDKEEGRVPESSGILGVLVIEINLASSISDWVFDTGSCAHICSNVQVLRNKRKLEQGQVQLKVGNGALVAATFVGTVDLTLPTGLVLTLHDVYFVPSISKNIISISVLDCNGYSFTIKDSCCSFSKDSIYYGSAYVREGLYILDLEMPVLNVNAKRLKTSHKSSTLIWHCRLGHINDLRIKKLQDAGLLDQFDFESIDTCESCLRGKMTKAPFKKKGERASDLLSLIHSDVCGPMSTSARGGFLYFVTFTDDFSRYGYVYLIRHKSETFEKFKEFKNEVENQLNKKIKVLRSDRGGEYMSLEFGSYLKEHGIVSQFTPPGTPQWNGVSERRNRTLLDMVRSMMSQASLPISFWGYALETAAYTLNRVPSKSVEKTPYELWYGKAPIMFFLKIWGCEAFVKRQTSDKLGPKSDKLIFVGYPKETKGYYFYNQTENKIIVARHGTFLEKEFLVRRNSRSDAMLEEIQDQSQEENLQIPSLDVPVSGSHDGLESSRMIKTIDTPQEVLSQVGENLTEDHEPSINVEEEIVPPIVENFEAPEPEAHVLRRSTRVIQAPDRYLGLHEVSVLDTEDPLTYKDAMGRPDSESWLKAMKSEVQSMYDNQVWDLVDAPLGVKPVENKWVFKRKTDMDGNLTTYKARLVAKGYRQVQGIDYEETFSPVAMFKSIRILLAIAAFYDYEIWQMDVKTAFLNGDLEEEVYMVQPEGFIDPENAKKICKLKRSIYGLKQASRSWNIRFDREIKKLGFVKLEDEPCVYKMISGSVVIFLVLYVDDILLFGNSIPEMRNVKSSLESVFSMKDLGEASYILGIKIYRDRSKRLIGLSQDTYLDKILKRFGMADSKKGAIPMVTGTRLSKTQCPIGADELKKMSEVPYASAIGSIMYAMICTRPDISYALSATSRYQSNPGIPHWAAVKNILKYLRNTKEKFLVYGGDTELVVSGYTDASFQTDIDDSRSQSGYVFMLNGGAVSWKSSKQETVAFSTTEAEYIAACEAAKEGVWIKKFLMELEVVPSASDPITLYCDNNGAIAQAKEPRSHQKSKHVLRRFHLIREIIERGDVRVCKVDTDSNTADPLTKPLPQAKHLVHTSSMGIRLVGDWL